MEIIKYVCPIILLIFSVLAIVCAFMISYSENRKDTENKLLIAFCISSAIWSLGFGALIVQTSTEIAYWCRAFGMIGTIMYLITGQMLISHLSGIQTRLARLFNTFAGLGIFVYFLTVKRGQTVYHLDTSGMTYSFTPGPANTIYTLYSLLLAVFMFGISLYMVFSKIKRVCFFGIIFILVDAAMLLGTILDTVFPLLGIPAIPGSTMTQFLGVVVVYLAIRANNRSKINISNMSEFIYYSLSMPVLVYNSSKQLQIANDAAAKFFSIKQEQIPQKDISLEMLFDLGNDSVFDFEGTSSNIDSVCIQNQVPCNLAISKIKDRYNDIIGYIIIITDLSERMKTLAHLEEAKQDAESANRSKSDFLANMSHEIRTPMNAILGFSELILKTDVSNTVNEYATDIKSSCLSLLAIINDILDISKLDSGKAELSCNNYHTSALLQEVYHMIEIQAQKKGLHFEMNVDPRIPNELYGDKTRLRGILINLLNNAVKYTEKGSVIFNIRLLGMENNSATLEYSVTDTGIGIKESAIEHLFDTFTRFDSKRNTNIEGTGLGLSIVNGYVNLMGGTIKVDSIYGRGTTFTVTLKQDIIDDSPLNITKTTPAAESSALNAGRMWIPNTHVLVTDDNQINLKVIKNTLEYYGLMVDTAPSGKQALELCKETMYDIVFMDQMMPGMDGIEAMQQIRNLSSHYAPGGPGKIIVLTANAILGVRDELLAQGFDEYLSKPIQFPELEKILKQFIPDDKFAGASNTPAAQDGTTALIDLLPQINVAVGLFYCGDNYELYLDILRIIYEDASAQLNTLQNFWEKSDIPDFTIHIHGMKTQLLNIGYSTLAEDAKALEMAGKNNHLEYIEENLAAFVEAYKDLEKQLGNVFTD